MPVSLALRKHVTTPGTESSSVKALSSATPAEDSVKVYRNSGDVGHLDVCPTYTSLWVLSPYDISTGIVIYTCNPSTLAEAGRLRDKSYSYIVNSESTAVT